jgi:serine/threonine protein kinase
VRYQLSTAEIAQPIEVLGSRAHRREPTTSELERLAETNGDFGQAVVARRYRVERLLGRGGMACVYAAHDTVLDRPVALKVLSEDYCGQPQILARFLREARINARLHHPNVVEVLDFGSSRSGVIYLAMELLVGEDLRRTLARRRTLAWPRVRELMLEICAGLEAAHGAGIVHRDLKPSNCFRVVDGRRESICLVDFGIATSMDDPVSERLTMANYIVGTPEYMSPEQARGERVDHRADIYAAGLILGELLTGALPFRAATGPAMLAAHIYEPVAPLRSLAPPGVSFPAALEAIYARALRKDPAERFANVEELAAALRAVDATSGVVISGAYDRCPEPIVEPVTQSSEAPAEAESRWLSYAAAASIAFLVGALGAFAVASSIRPAAEPPPVDAPAVDPGERP